MSVLIKGVEMPKTCHDCRLYEADIYFCEAADRDVVMDDAYADNGRCSFCPLVEVPTPHGRLVDADIPEDVRQVHGFFNDYDLQELLEAAPTVIEAEG